MKCIRPLLLALYCMAVLTGNGQVRTVKVLSEGWKFSRLKTDDSHSISFNDESWQTVSVPHDWAIYGPFDKEIDKQIVAIEQNGEKIPTEKTGRTGSLPYIGEGWYRKEFELPDFNASKKVILLFEGAMSEPQVYINGAKVGEWNYGYSYFYFDITSQLIAGRKNLISVHLTNKGESSRWYPGAGLYRKVSVIVKNKENIDQWGTYITTPSVTADEAKVKIKTRVSVSNSFLVTNIMDDSGKLVGKDTARKIFGNEFEQDIAVMRPRLWSPETPVLYRAVSRLYVDDELKDEVSTSFGIRTISYTADKGFQLNGVTRKFKGVCLHHDLGPLGAAVNKAALRRQLTILKDMGCDAIRSSHNMPSLEQLELCDEMGFMFLAESFDEWARPKVKNGYNLYFEKDMEKDVVNLIRATRNHPSIVMWSAGNEVPDQWGFEGAKRAKRIQDIFHREDPTRPVTVGMDQVQNAMKYGFGAVLDIPGLNYRLKLYEEAYKTFPQGFLLGSETASTVSSRGVYKFPVIKAAQTQYDDHQSSSYDLEYCSWSNLPDDDFVVQDDKPWVIGEFVWTGFDYLGEPTPYDNKWPSRSSYFGINDLAGLPKDRYYLYRSRWNVQSPTLHVLPHWNWSSKTSLDKGRVGEVTPVFVYTSYDSAELFVNGKSMGVQKKHNATPQNRYRLMWNDVKYEPGAIKVIAFGKDGKPAAEQVMITAGKPHHLKLEADRKTIAADGQDISFVTVSIVDKDGNLCPVSDQSLQFIVKGSGIFKAVCNGDATSLEPFHLPIMKTFGGKLVVLVQATKKEGIIELNISGKGLKPGRLSLKTVNL